jgi:preprotein translocase subunit YajC
VGGFLILILILGVIWVLFFLPARRRSRSHAAMQHSIDVGDEIITAGGLHAFVRELGDDQLQVEIAPGVVVTVDRRAVAAVAQEIEVEVDAEPAEPLEPGSEQEPDAVSEDPRQPG